MGSNGIKTTRLQLKTILVTFLKFLVVYPTILSKIEGPMTIQNKLCLLFLTWCLCSCSLKQKAPDEQVTLVFKNFSKKSSSLNAGGISTADFQCFAINVMGSGINSTHADENVATVLDQDLNQGRFCAYPGVTSKTFTLANSVALADTVSIKLTVPSGAKRIIQVLGFFDPLGIYCNSGKLAGEVIEPAGSRVSIFTIAQVIVDLFRDTTVSLSNTFDGLSALEIEKRYASCGDNPAPTAGPAASPTPSPTPIPEPNTIANLKLWYKADFFINDIPSGSEIGGVWNNAVNGTLPSLIPVSSARGVKPKFFSADGPNAKPTVSFTGGGEYFNAPDAGFGSVINSLTFFVVAKLITEGPLIGISKDVSFDEYKNYIVLGSTGNAGKTTFRANKEIGVKQELLLDQTAAFSIYFATLDTTAAQTELNYAVLGRSSNRITGATVTALDLNGTIFVGKNDVTTVNGSISEILVYDRLLTTAEIQTVKDYLKNKFNLP